MASTMRSALACCLLLLVVGAAAQVCPGTQKVPAPPANCATPSPLPGCFFYGVNSTCCCSSTPVCKTGYSVVGSQTLPQCTSGIAATGCYKYQTQCCCPNSPLSG